MKTEYVPFTEEMIPAAGALLAKRHACSRRSLPLLPARFEDPHMAVKAIEARRLGKERLFQSLPVHFGSRQACTGRTV